MWDRGQETCDWCQWVFGGHMRWDFWKLESEKVWERQAERLSLKHCLKKTKAQYVSTNVACDTLVHASGTVTKLQTQIENAFPQENVCESWQVADCWKVGKICKNVKEGKKKKGKKLSNEVGKKERREQGKKERGKEGRKEEGKKKTRFLFWQSSACCC